MVKKIFSFAFLLALIFCSYIGIASALTINDTIFFSSVSNSTIYVNESITLDQIIVNSNSLEVYNLSSNAKFTNINQSYISYIDFINLPNTLIFLSNFTGLFNLNKNISLYPNNYSYIYPSYILSEPRIQSLGYYEGEPFSLTSTGGSHRTTRVESELNNGISIPSTFTADCTYVNTIDIYNTSTHTTLYSNQFICYNNSVSFNYLYLESGNTTITFSRSNVIVQRENCENIIGGLNSGISFIAILIVIIFAMLVLAILNKNEDKFDGVKLQRAIFSVVFISLILILSIVIISMIPGC